MSASIQIPKDVFVRLRPASEDAPLQGILFGQREECLDRGLVIHVKGFFLYESCSQDLISTIAKLMNWKGQTVLGWFAAPENDIINQCEPTQIASAYFRTFQSAMLKVIVANYLKQHSEYDVREITPLIARESCALFQDLIGLLIRKIDKPINPILSPLADIDTTTAQAFFSAPSLNEVLNLLCDVKGDVVETHILQELADVLPRINGLGSNFTHNNSITDDMDDECDDVRELFSIWGNGSGTVNKKIRTRRASTTDIAEGLSRSASFVADDLMDDSNKKKKGLDNENIVDKNITKNINTTNDNIATNIIPAPFIIVPGQASEYMHQAHNDDSIHHSTEYDESILSSLTTSHFSPTNSTQSNSSQNEYVMTYAQQRINITYNAIAQHITSHTQEKITLYEKSCREYEMLLEILETLNSVGDKHSLSKKLENSIEDIGDCDNEENAEDVIGEGVEVDKKEDKVMAVDNNNLNPFKSKKSEAESSDSELIKKKDVKKKKKKTPDNNNCSDKEIIKKSPKKWHKKVIKTKDVEIEENSNGNASYKLFRWLFIFSTILSSLNGVSTLNLPQFTIKSKVIELLDEEGGTSDFTMKLFTISALVILGGVFAGLTIGLMGLDETNLQVLMVAGDSKERIYARKVFELLKRGKHWVLVTLLLSNVIVNETLPIIMDSLFGGAICVRYGLAIGAGFSWFVLFLMYTMFPIAYPIALLLDYFLGEHHGIMYRKSELKTFVSLHKNGGIESLNEDEVQIIGSVLDLREKSVSAIMTPLENSYTLSADCLLDEKTVDEILSAGYSRIPVYEPPNPTHFIGMLLVKKLITYDPEDAWSVRDFPLSSLPETSPDTSCLDILNYFQEGRSHMVLVSEDPGGDKGALGVITLEDVIEELIGEEIIDETDVYVDVQNKIKVVRHPPRQSRQRSYPYYKSNLLKSSAILHSSSKAITKKKKESNDIEKFYY
ncbi:3258_t:CDS:10 [Entrophospora sp. SA101]|nr:3258_t:CDS:10 [Entrophospora sp. SA101]